MKKMYLFLLMAFLALGSGQIFAQQKVLENGFETTDEGKIPNGWSLSEPSAMKTWKVEKDKGNNLFDPAACAIGKGRIKFAGNGDGSGNEVMLISPQMDITALAEPILVFDYAAVRTSTGVVDSLKVYFRMRSDRDWILVKSLGEADNWTRDTVEFPSKTKTFQIAFGGVDREGRGVALDNVSFSSRPVSQEVSNVDVYNKTHNSAKMRWSGSLKAIYHVKISTQELRNPAIATEAEGLFISQDVEYATNMQINATTNKALTASTTYYYYIQTDLGYGDVSGWVSGEFTSACNPVESFSTSFDAPADLACWTTIGESHGTFIATRPNNVPDSVMSGLDNTGNPIFMMPENSRPDPYSGASCLWMPVKSNNINDYSRVYAVSPRLADNVNLKDMQLSFWMKANTKQIHLRLIVSDWPDDFSNAKESGEIVVRNPGVYERFTLTFEDIVSKGRYIVFMIDGSEEILKSPQFPTVNIDDIVLDPKTTCSEANKVIMYQTPEMQGSSVTLRWNRTGASSFEVKVTNKVINPANELGVVYDGIVSEPELVLSNLVPAMRYYYYVRPICADGVKGTWSNTQSFDTECIFDGVSVPFRENFDKYEAGINGLPTPLPICWTTKYPAGMNGYGVYLTSGNEAYSDFNYITCFNEGSTYISTPKINANLKDCQLRFVFAMDNAYLPLEVGIMSDPTDNSTFVKIAEFTVGEKNENIKSWTWVEKLVSFEGYTGEGKYVTFHLPTANAAYRIDDVIVESASSCADPTNLKVVGATVSSVSVDWLASESKETEWDLAYLKSGADFSSANIVEGISSHPYVLQNLSANTVYDIYVRSVCSKTAKGIWIGPISAKTIAPATMPYTCDFEDSMDAMSWTLLNGTQANQWITGSAVSKELIGGLEVGNTMYITSDYGATNFAVAKETYSYATRLLELEAGLIDFEFDWRLTGADEYKGEKDYYGNPKFGTNGVIIPFLVPEDIVIQGGVPGNLYQLRSKIDKGSWRGIEMEACIPNGWLHICGGIGVLAHHTADWQHFKFTYPLRKSGRYNLVIVYITPSSRKFDITLNAAAIDNVSIKLNKTDCVPAVDLEVRDITQSSAKVHFLNYNATQWKVVLADSLIDTTVDNLDVLTTAHKHVIYVDKQSTNPLSLQQLQPETDYWLYMRPECGTADMWQFIHFRTICQSQNVPISYTFDEPEFNEFGMIEGMFGPEEGRLKSFMDCWRRMPDVSPGSYVVGASAGIYQFQYEGIAESNSTNMLMLSSDNGHGGYNADTYVASPELLPNVKDLMLVLRVTSEFDYAERPINLEVGVMTDPLDSSTFELVETITPMYKGQWRKYYIYFDGYSGLGKHIALRLPQISDFNPKIYIDDLTIDSVRGCVPTRGLKVENITENSADIMWSTTGIDGSCHVKVNTEPLGRWEDCANVFDDTIVAKNRITINNLKASRQYYVYVRTVCSENGGYSEGMGELKFRTICSSSITLPYFEDFESYELNSLPNCWYVMENNPNGGSRLAGFNVTTNLGEVYKQLGRLSLSFYTGSQNLFPTMLAMPAVVENIQEVVMTFKALQISSDRLIVGVVSDVTDPSTFVSVDTINCAVEYVWEDKVVRFDKYTGSGKHIAFRLPPSYFGSTFTIDEIMIRKSNMVCADATAPQVLNIEPTAAMVRWADNPTVESFELKVATSDINPELEEGDVMVTTKFVDLQTKITGLKPATTYYVYLRNVCSAGQNGYWSKPTMFTTACDGSLSIPFYEDFKGYGDIADVGFFPVCWRKNISMYGSISPADQIEPYVENSTRPSVFMKSVYDGADGAYSVVDVATPKVDFGINKAAGYVMRLAFKSNKKHMPIYVGLMSDPSDPSTFVVYDTLRNNEAEVWEKQEVNFLYYAGDEQYIAFRINSLDAVPNGYNHDEVTGEQVYNGYQVNITDIQLLPKSDCMPPYRVRADVRPNRAFISWVPGNENSKQWVYFMSDASKMDSIPFTNEDFKTHADNNWANTIVIDTVSETSLVINNLSDWTDYYMYIRNADCDSAFWSQYIDLSARSTCGVIKEIGELPIAPDFRNNGLGVGSEPQFSSYFDCWSRTDDFVSDPIAYPYITNNAELLFHTVADSACTAIVRSINKDGLKFLPNTQLRLSANAIAEGAKMIIGVVGRYTKGWPSVEYFDFMPFDTINLTLNNQEYVVKFTDFVWQAPNPNQRYGQFAPAISIVKNNADFVVTDFSWEEIPYCFTPELNVISRGTTEFKVEWQKLKEQDEWKVAFGEHGFNLEKAKLVPRTDTNYTVVNLKEGTPYEFYVQSLCLNGMTSEWGRVCVTTDQTPAAYPYKSTDFADATVIDGDDTLYYAYRTIEIPAGPHTLSFDWKTADATGAYLRVFTVPSERMITADNNFAIDEFSVPQGWSHVATLKGNSTWTASSHAVYIKTAETGAVNVVFVWTKCGDKVRGVVRNISLSSSNECTVPEELYASQITSTSATLNWTSFNATAWDINYWETNDKANTSKSLMDFNPGDRLTGLTADTEYSFEVSSVCKPGIYSEPYTFRTACATIDTLVETFDSGVIGGCWSLYKGKFDEVVNGQSYLIPTNNGWDVTSIPVLGSSQTSNARLTIAGNDCNYWLVTPSVSLVKTSALSFDLAFTAYNDKQNVNPNGQTDDRFIVAISTDEGQTWNPADAIIWNNVDDLNYSLNRIGNHSRRVEVDLSAYTGKTVRIAFYGESSIEVETNDIHIDSVRIDDRVLKQVTGETCQGYSYYAQGFSIDREDLKAQGVHKFVRVERANSKSNLDTTYVLSLNVKESKVHEYNAQICSNKKYNDHNFLNLTETGTYTKVVVASNGCDSTIILNLTVDEAYKLERSITIKASELPYTFACHEFPVGTVSNKYEINCKTQAGCDSIIVLDLTVEGSVGVNNVVKNETLILTPNPVEPGRLITVNYDLEQVDLNGLTIKVFNSLGQLVSLSTPEGLPLAFNAPHASGVYNVHIILPDNRVLLGRFIVK